MLNPVWLKTFITLVDIGHFTKTADKLSMTQPGVSQHIAKLEKACGHVLIARENKGVDMTEQGRLLYQYAIQLANNEQALFERLNFDDPFSGQCTVACSGALALLLYPQLLALQVQHKKLVVKLNAAPNHQILTEIQAGNVDIGIITDVADKRLFDVQALAQEPLCLVFASSVNFDASGEHLLTELGLIDHPDGKHYLALYLAQNQSLYFSHSDINAIPISGYVNQISQILEPVAKGLGFTVLPRSVVDSFHGRQQLTIFNPQKPVLETLYLLSKKNRVLPARIETIKAMLQAHFDCCDQ